MEILPLRLAERWFLAATVVVVIAYSWLLARALEPRTFTPRAVVTEIVWLKKGEAVDAGEPGIRHSKAAVGMRRELEWMDDALKFLGPFHEAPILVVATDESERSVIGDERVVISGDLAAREGYVLKALLKSWLYQNASVELTSSLLRMEIASEFLSAVVRGNGRGAVIDNWLAFTASFETSGMDAGNWGGAELRRFAGRSPKMNPFAFKPLVVAMLCEMFERTPSLQRFEYLRSWVRSLRLPPSRGAEPARALPITLTEWKSWVLAEFDVLSSGPADLKRAVIARAGLDAAPSVSTWLVRENGKLDLQRLAEASAEPTVVDSGTDHLWLIHRGRSGRSEWISLSERDRTGLRARNFVWEGCERLRLGELLNRSQGADRLLYISSCDRGNATETGWRAFLSGGLREFAIARPDVPFAQLKRSAVELALRRGKLEPGNQVGNFLSLRLNPVFGIESAKWNRDLHAYRVLGAIEAFEWIRGSPLAATMYN